MMKPWSWQVLYILMPHEPVVQRIHWFSYVVLPPASSAEARIRELEADRDLVLDERDDYRRAWTSARRERDAIKAHYNELVESVRTERNEAYEQGKREAESAIRALAVKKEGEA